MARERPVRCDVELLVRNQPVGRFRLEEEPSSAVLVVKGLRVNGQEFLVPKGGEIAFKAMAGDGIAQVTLTLFPSSLRLLDQAEWTSPAEGVG